jgi:hypothetical protein
VNLLLTFLLAGLWHGASWSFVLWGGLHGIALVLHRIWSRLGLRLPVLVGWLVTFVFVNTSWVIFRAINLADAVRVLKGMVGVNGLSVNSTLVNLFQFSDKLQEFFEGLRAGAIYLPAQMYWSLAGCSVILFFFPNSCQIGGLIKQDTSELIANDSFVKRKPFLVRLHTLFFFKPTFFWALLTGIFFSIALYRLLKIAPTEFLYFNF